MKRPVSHPEEWGGVGGRVDCVCVCVCVGGGSGVIYTLSEFYFYFIFLLYTSFIQGQSANSRKDNDLRSVIQSREDALKEVEKLVKHAESLERKYNEKV